MMPNPTPKTIWTDMRGNFSPYPTLTCNKPWDADKPCPPEKSVPVTPPSSYKVPESVAPPFACNCYVEIHNLTRRRIKGRLSVQFLQCPGHEAAPDLYAALAAYVEHFGDPLKVARAALAKARGEKP